jgi:hypothetical protein
MCNIIVFKNAYNFQFYNQGFKIPLYNIVGRVFKINKKIEYKIFHTIFFFVKKKKNLLSSCKNELFKLL